MDFIVVSTFYCSGVTVVSGRGPLWGVAPGAAQPTTTSCVPGTNSVCSRRTRRCSVPSTEKKWTERSVQEQENYFKVVENEHVYYMCIYLYMYSISVFYSLLITKIDSMNSLDICVHAFVCFI